MNYFFLNAENYFHSTPYLDMLSNKFMIIIIFFLIMTHGVEMLSKLVSVRTRFFCSHKKILILEDL